MDAKSIFQIVLAVVGLISAFDAFIARYPLRLVRDIPDGARVWREVTK